MPEFERRQNRARSDLIPATPDQASSQLVHAESPIPAQQLGNQAAQRFAESCPLGLPSPSLCPYGGACHTCPAPVQAKLRINKPGDKYEQEADRVADQVMRMPGPRLQRQVEPQEEEEQETVQTKPIAAQITPLVQRLEYPEEEEEEEPVQAERAGGQTSQVRPDLAAQIRSFKGNGQPLSRSVRNFFEPRFGCDLSQVRVHTDGPAAETARSVNAHAFTIGRDVVFRGGQYAPDTMTARRLLAHELTHTIQQGGTTYLLQRTVNAKTNRNFQSNPQAARVCLVHLHADEQNALAAAQDIRSRYCANLVNVANPINHRCVEVAGLSGGRSCMVNPNRIFSKESVTRACAFGWCNRRGLPGRLARACSCNSRLKKEAAQELHSSFRHDLIEAINQCRGGRGRDNLDVSANLLPIIAFHNTAVFNVGAYRLGEPEGWAAATTAEIRASAQQRGLTGRLPRRIRNPMGPASTSAGRRSKRYYRNFFVTTDIEDFLNLGAAGHNVVLQSPNPRPKGGRACTKDDGSLSIALKSARYINIEVAGKTRNARIVVFNTSMAETALRSLGVSPGSCTPARPGTTGP